MDAAFNSHEKERGLDIGNKVLEGALIGGVHQLRAVEALLALALLHQEVIAAVTVVRELAAACSVDAFLSAAVGLELRHLVAGV